MSRTNYSKMDLLVSIATTAIVVAFMTFVFIEIKNSRKCESDGKHIYSYDWNQCYEVIR